MDWLKFFKYKIKSEWIFIRVNTVSKIHHIQNFWKWNFFNQKVQMNTSEPPLDLLLVKYIKSLRKHAYSNILKILSPKNENFQIKFSDIFHISAQNIDCGYSLELPWWDSSNEYPQSMFLSRNKKNNVYLCKHQLYCIKVGFKGVKLYSHVLVTTWWFV